MAVEVKVAAFRDIFQYEAGRKGLYSNEYLQLSAQILMDKEDMANLGVKDGARVSAENEVGKVVLVARASGDKAHPGVAFMVESPWSHQLEDDEPCRHGALGFRGISATVTPSQDNVTELSEIVQRLKE
ncbi:molybdopterin dinucleotide binding domain-containing protein [Methanothrix sp.]|jgi:formylmethanofuran dehydrogenase subunit D|uniref:molybdopterin dinucleotide binding domain-containing protein n=1 Tax=Methanothrix sp. TaxID=90426 RepID=UPI003BB658C4